MSQSKKMTRRSFTKKGLILSGAVLAAPMLRSSFAQAQKSLSEGKIGGPTGFKGAEAYQYGPNTPEGRAMEALREMVGKGKAPKSIRFAMSEGSIGQLTQPFPNGAPSVKELFEKESGVKLDIIGVPSGQEFNKAIQDTSTKAGTYDIYTIDFNRLGDLAETGGIEILDEFVDKHRPDWGSPNGYVGGERGVSLVNKYRGKYYGVAQSGTYMCWVYRRDLFEDAAMRRAHKSVTGRDLEIPRTYAELDQTAQFFTDHTKGKIHGCTDLRNQGWGYVNWYSRYTTMAKPNQFLFSDKGEILINGPEGEKATQEYVKSLSHHAPDAVSWGWPEQYGSMADGTSAMTCAFPNMPKFLDNPSNEGSKVVGKLGSFAPLGRDHGKDRVSRSLAWYSLVAAVSKQAKNSEACYLFLQWVGGPQIASWIVANPAGYFDPWQNTQLNDPLVVKTYHEYHVKTIRETIARSTPSISYPGATAFHNALDENLVAALTGTKSAAQAMADTERQWKRIIRRVGKEKLVDAIRFNNSFWPKNVDAAK